MNIYLIRHAESAPDYDIDESDWPLSTLGQRQAQRLAGLTARLSLDAVYTSPYRRSVATVRPIASTHGLDVTVVDDLREKKLTEGYLDDFMVHVKRSFANLDYRLPGGESSNEARKRGLEALDEIIDRHDRGDSVVIGSHGNLITLILSAFDDAVGFEHWRSMGNPDVFVLRCVTEPHWDQSAEFADINKRFVDYALRWDMTELTEDVPPVQQLREQMKCASTPRCRLVAKGRLGDRLRLDVATVGEAVMLLREAAEQCLQTDEPKLWISNSLRLAVALQYAERHHEALGCFERTLEAVGERDDRFLEDFCLQHMGKCLAEVGRLDEARRCLKSALELRKNRGDDALVNSSRRALSVIESFDIAETRS